MTHETTPHLDFSNILLKTRVFIIRVNSLLKAMRNAGLDTSEALDEDDYEETSIDDIHRILKSVEFAMDLIGRTYNASINHEALAAFNQTIEHAERELEAEWAQSLLAETLFGTSEE